MGATTVSSSPLTIVCPGTSSPSSGSGMLWITASEQSSQVFLLMSSLRLKGLVLPTHAASCKRNRHFQCPVPVTRRSACSTSSRKHGGHARRCQLENHHNQYGMQVRATNTSITQCTMIASWLQHVSQQHTLLTLPLLFGSVEQPPLVTVPLQMSRRGSRSTCRVQQLIEDAHIRCSPAATQW